MKILALEPYYGGSHKAFLSGWSGRSRHTWTVLSLPPYKWKWRMRHGAITLADEVRERVASGETWDVLFCSDMLNLAEFVGLAPPAVGSLPRVAYFHENQLTYPVRFESERDYHFVLTNLTTALSATQVWFNSAFHRDSFLEALPAFLKRMPDYHPTESIERIRARSAVWPQGVEDRPVRSERVPGPLRICWAARWEDDKNPETLFLALKTLKLAGVEFRVSVIGEQFREAPAIFEWARQYFYHHIDAWGYLESRPAYEQALADADVIVSTAHHEFFGISVVEGIAAGAYPLLPNRLAYPEVLGLGESDEMSGFFYESEAEGLAARLSELADRVGHEDLWHGDPERARRVVARFLWPNLGPRLDEALEQVAGGGE